MTRIDSQADWGKVVNAFTILPLKSADSVIHAVSKAMLLALDLDGKAGRGGSRTTAAAASAIF